MLSKTAVIAAFGAAIAASAVVLNLYRKLNSNVVPQKQTLPIIPPDGGDDTNLRTGIRFLPRDSESAEIGFLNIVLPAVVNALFPSFVANWLMVPEDDELEVRDVNVMDARKDRSSLRFEDAGFALVKAEELRGVQWDPSDGESTKRQFRELLIPRLREIYPDATRFEYVQPHVRGGDGLGKSLIPGAHLDFFPDDRAIRDLFERYPLIPENDFRLRRLPAMISPRGGQLFFRYVLGEKDTDEDEMKVVLGLWMPAGMNTPICDYPLAVMDARTLDVAQDVRPLVSRANFFGKEIRHPHAAIKHRPGRQRWYYHSYQEPDEMLVFRHYARNQRGPVNPHASVRNPRCPDTYETRKTIDFRVAVFFPKQKNATLATGASE